MQKVVNIHSMINYAIGCLLLNISLQYIFLEKANAQQCDDVTITRGTKLLCITPISSTLKNINMSGGFHESECNLVRPIGKNKSRYDRSNYTYILAFRGFTSFKPMEPMEVSIVVSEFLPEDDPSIWIEEVWPGLFQGREVHCQDIYAGKTERLETPLNLNPNSIYGIRVGKIGEPRGIEDHEICVSLSEDGCPISANF